MKTQKRIRLHPGDVQLFVDVASSCPFDVFVGNVYRSSRVVDAKSIVGVLGLDFSEPMVVTYDGYKEELDVFLRAKAVTA